MLRGQLRGQGLGHITELSEVRLLMLLLVINSGMDKDPGVGDMVKLRRMEDRGPGAEVMHHRPRREQLHAKRLE